MQIPVSIRGSRSLALVMLLAFGAAAHAQRAVAWVHGFNGNALTWDIYDAFVTGEFPAGGPSGGFNDGAGMPAFQQEVLASAAPFAGPGIGAIGVGHSAGGIALRGAARLQPDNRFAGIITVGSPNQGGAIINAAQDGDVARAFGQGCRDLAAGPSAQAIPIPFIRGLVVSTLCALGRELVLENELEEAAGGPTPTDLRVGSAYLAALNATDEPIPTLSIWGNETGPVHWHYLSSLITDTQDDEVAVDLAEDALRLYRDNATFNWWEGLFGWWRAQQWRRGQRWIENSEGVYNEFMDCRGGRRRVTQINVLRFNNGWACNGQFPTGSSEWVQCINQRCPQGYNNCFVEQTRTVTVESNDESDGFFCEETQVLQGLLENDEYEARGVNHAEETTTAFETTDGRGDVMEAVLIDIFRNREDIFRLDP